MLIKNQKSFNMGAILALTFLGVLVLIFSPLFGGKNGLEFSDDLFNKLSKGSSYFLKGIETKAKQFEGKSISVTVNLGKRETVDKAVKVLSVGGAQLEPKDVDLTLNADLGKLVANVLKDSDAMYNNDGKSVSARYGMDEREVMELWWNVLNKSVKELQKQKKIEEANLVSETLKKGIEPAYNYYGIEAQKVSDKFLVMSFLLIFYVAYTMWWGYAIYYMFEGLGLSMKKSKVKKEV